MRRVVVASVSVMTVLVGIALCRESQCGGEGELVSVRVATRGGLDGADSEYVRQYGTYCDAGTSDDRCLGSAIFWGTGCGACHSYLDAAPPGPILLGIWGDSRIQRTNRRVVVVDDDYLLSMVTNHPTTRREGLEPRLAVPSTFSHQSAQALARFIGMIARVIEPCEAPLGLYRPVPSESGERHRYLIIDETAAVSAVQIEPSGECRQDTIGCVRFDSGVAYLVFGEACSIDVDAACPRSDSGSLQENGSGDLFLRTMTNMALPGESRVGSELNSTGTRLRRIDGDVRTASFLACDLLRLERETR